MLFLFLIKRYWLAVINFLILAIIAGLSMECIQIHANDNVYKKVDFIVQSGSKSISKEDLQQWVNDVKAISERTVEQSKSELNVYITMWLSIVAAICTMLPIAINFSAYRNYDAQLKALSKQQEGLEEGIKSLQLPSTIQLMVMFRTMAESPNKERPIEDEKNVLQVFLKEIRNNLCNQKNSATFKVCEALCYVEQLRILTHTFENFAVKEPTLLEKMQCAKYGLSDLADRISLYDNNISLNADELNALNLYAESVLSCIEEMMKK